MEISRDNINAEVRKSYPFSQKHACYITLKHGQLLQINVQSMILFGREYWSRSQREKVKY